MTDRRIHQLETLFQVSQDIHAATDARSVMRTLVISAIRLVNAKSGAVGIIENGSMVFREYLHGGRWENLDYTFEPGFGVPGHVIQTRKPYVSNDTKHDPHVIPEIRQALDFHQLIDVPIINRTGCMLGCFEIHDSAYAHPFDENDTKVLEGLATHAAIALKNANLISERKHTEKIMEVLAEVSTTGTGQKFLQNVVKDLCDLLHAECTIVSKITHENHVQALAMQRDGKQIEQYAYDLSGTPCENVVTKGYCEYPEHIRELYPDDQLLIDLQAESYVGIPIRNKKGKAIGILCAISRCKQKPSGNTRNMLEIIAARVSLEIERMRTEETMRQRLAEAEESRQSMLYMLEDMNETSTRIEQSKREWEATFDAVTDSIFIHDVRGNIIRANHAYTRQAGMEMCDIIGKPYWQVFPVLDGPMQSCLCASNKEKIATATEDDEEFRIPDGRLYCSHSYAVRDKKGQYHYSVHFIQDITERRQVTKRLQQSLEGTIKVIASAAEARDPYTAGHQARVAKLACAIAKAIGLDLKRIEGIHWGCMIHDIGKIRLPAEILSKPSKLSENEYALIKEHPQVGYDILSGVEFPWPVADIVYQHHERMDGSGYPQRLQGDSICLEARIAAVADVVEAIASHRPYRPSMGIDTALAEIKCGRGRQYDLRVADTCCTLFEENIFHFDH